jgi:GrpB-like predicted nucleotidyltransferase (UPF0157 family)
MALTMTSPPGSIILAEYDPGWPQLFTEERDRLQRTIGQWVHAIEHVGSTAIPGMSAKPIIDIGIALRRFEDALHCITPLVEAGWTCMGEFGIPGRIFFRKTTDDPLPGQAPGRSVGRTHQIHMYELTHEQFAGHLVFRDYLRAHPQAARAYQQLKVELADRHPDDVEAYADAKSEFVRKIWTLAGRGGSKAPGPVTIVDHDPGWAQMYESEKMRIVGAIGEWLVEIQHVGSTSVPGLAAKPVVDIMPGVRSLNDDAHFVPAMQAIGYDYVPVYEDDIPDRRYFRRGEPRLFHVHVAEFGGDFWRRHIDFRDYLRAHPDTAAEYAVLKRRLATEHGDDRLGYVNAKSSFIEGVLETALPSVQQ